MNRTARRLITATLVVLASLSFSARGEAAAIVLSFSDLDPLGFGVARTPADLSFTITNNTGVTWTDFHVTSNGIGAFTESYVGPGTFTYSGTAAPGLHHTLDIVGLNVAAGGTLSFTQSLFCQGEICALGWTGSAQPTTTSAPPPNGNGTQVPEPSSLLMLGSGLAFVALRRRR